MNGVNHKEMNAKGLSDGMLRTLREIGEKRRIDILITTHNPALTDELGVDMIPFIQVVHRDKKDGIGKITLLENLHNLL